MGTQDSLGVPASPSGSPSQATPIPNAVRPTGRVSIFAPRGTPICDTCPNLQKDGARSGGWCLNPANRVFTAGWPQGFTPSQGFDGTCELHPLRATGTQA